MNEIVAKAKNYFNTPITTIINNALIDFRFNPITQKNAFELEWDNFNIQFQNLVVDGGLVMD